MVALITFTHKVSFIAGPRPAASELIRIGLAKFAASLANRLVGHNAEAQAEPEVQPDGVANDFRREAVILVTGD